MGTAVHVRVGQALNQAERAERHRRLVRRQMDDELLEVHEWDRHVLCKAECGHRSYDRDRLAGCAAPNGNHVGTVDLRAIRLYDGDLHARISRHVALRAVVEEDAKREGG